MLDNNWPLRALSELFNKSNKIINRLLTVISVVLLVLVVVELMVHLKFELACNVSDALQDELKPVIIALLWLVEPTWWYALVDNKRRVERTLVAQYVLLKVTYELIRFVMDTTFFDYEEYVVDLVVDQSQHIAHLAENERSVELHTAKADRVDDVEAFVGEHLEFERAWAGGIAHFEATRFDTIDVAALLE